MVIVVSEGDDEEGTRKKEYYDGTFEYLKAIGITILQNTAITMILFQ
jgi:hypothetical protein